MHVPPSPQPSTEEKEQEDGSTLSHKMVSSFNCATSQIKLDSQTQGSLGSTGNFSGVGLESLLSSRKLRKLDISL